MYATHGARLVAAARAILGSEDLARDAVQEALLHCWQAAREPDDARAWLLRTVVHRALHHARTRRRRQRHEALAAADRATQGGTPRGPRRAFGGAEGEPAAPDALGEAHDVRELGRVIAAALERLPASHRSAFERFEWQGWDYASIARAEGVPLGTVRSRLARARAQLRADLSGKLSRDPWCLDCARDRVARPT
ncbi:MAG: RNA polymerase sigma factor [Planctomycetes bacterium]|nr:RNA polymerase sigma factor [Planctomycetota bacterium]